MPDKTLEPSSTIMTTDHDILDPTETDQSELNIDPETVTQWVDKTLPVPHQASVDALAAKFSSLKKYAEDADCMSVLLKESFKPEITAPANTLARVLQTIEKEESGKKHAPLPLPAAVQAENAASPSSRIVPSPEHEADFPTVPLSAEPFVIEFPECKKSMPAYLMPIAALLFLCALVGSILKFEWEKDEQKAMANSDPAEEERLPTNRRAQTMANGGDPHSRQNSKAHMTSYELLKESAEDNSEDKKDGEKDEQKKEEEKVKSTTDAP